MKLKEKGWALGLGLRFKMIKEFAESALRGKDEMNKADTGTLIWEDITDLRMDGPTDDRR